MVQTAVGQCQLVGYDMAEYSFWNGGLRDYIVSEIEHYLKSGGVPEDFSANGCDYGKAFYNPTDFAMASCFEFQNALYLNNKESFDDYMTDSFYTYMYTNLPPDKKGLFTEITCLDVIEQTHKAEGIPLHVARDVMSALMSDGLSKALTNAMSKPQVVVPSSPVQEQAQAILNARGERNDNTLKNAQAERKTQSHKL